MIDPVTGEIIDEQQLAEQLLKQAKEQGVDLVGPDGLLNGLTKRVLETVLEAEMTEHLGYDKHGCSTGANAHPGTRTRSQRVLDHLPGWPVGARSSRHSRRRLALTRSPSFLPVENDRFRTLRAESCGL
jgi:hypothetical protein